MARVGELGAQAVAEQVIVFNNQQSGHGEQPKKRTIGAQQAAAPILLGIGDQTDLNRKQR